MATVTYWFGSWVAAGGASYLMPGATHHWVAWGPFSYGHSLVVTAHPVVLAGVSRALAVEDIQIQGDGSGRRIFYTVRNVGGEPVPGYGVGYTAISS